MLSRKYKVYRNFIVYLSFTASVIIAFFNSFLFNLKGAEVDAERFLDKAENWVDSGELALVIDAEFFIQYLGVLSYVGFQEFTFTLLGIALYYYSTVSLLNKINFFPPLAFSLITYLLFLSPSVLLRLGALLREPYVIFSLLIGLFLIFQNHFSQRNRTNKAAGFTLLIFGSIFHKAALAALPAFGVAYVIFSPARRRIKAIISLLFVICLVVLTIGPGLSELRGSSALNTILTGDTSSAEAIVSRKASRDARSTYDYGAAWESWSDILYSGIRANVYFYLKPFIWEVRTASDLYLSLENMMRALLILIILFAVIRLNDRPAMFLLVLYLIMNTIWAFGTTNYGTGARHHYSAQPMLLLVLLRISLLKQYAIAGRAPTQPEKRRVL